MVNTGSPDWRRKLLGRNHARTLRFIAAAALLLALSLACGGPETVVIATDGDYHPFNFINDDGEIDGFEREMADELCRRAEFECEWVINDWDAMIPDLVAEDFDAIIAGMSITDERDERIDFSEPYYPPTPSVYLARAGAGDEAVEGAIGAFGNSIYSDYLTQQGIPFVTFTSTDAQTDAILNGEVDAIMVDHAFAVEKLAEFAGRLAIVGPAVALDKGIGIGVRDGSRLKAGFDEALESMKADGALNELLLKWFGEDAETF